MSQSDEPNHTDNSTPADGVRYARYAGQLLGVLLFGLALRNIISGSMDLFTTIQTVYYVIYGALLNVPFAKVPEARWKQVLGLLIVLSILFVFLMIATVMFAYIAAADRGERLGVPGFEGTLIFLALMQVPAVIFQRNPDLLD